MNQKTNCQIISSLVIKSFDFSNEKLMPIYHLHTLFKLNEQLIIADTCFFEDSVQKGVSYYQYNTPIKASQKSMLLNLQKEIISKVQLSQIVDLTSLDQMKEIIKLASSDKTEDMLRCQTLKHYISDIQCMQHIFPWYRQNAQVVTKEEYIQHSNLKVTLQMYDINTKKTTKEYLLF